MPGPAWVQSGRSRHAVLWLAALGAASAALSDFVQAPPLLVLNASRSAPPGLYRVVPGPAARGDLVLLRPPEPVRRLLAERGYLPPGVPLLKSIAAGPGDRACRHGGSVLVNGRRVAAALAEDGAHRPLPAWSGCRTLGPDEVFVLRPHPQSFDSRYFGPVDAAGILGRAVPVWLFRRGTDAPRAVGAALEAPRAGGGEGEAPWRQAVP